MNTTLTQSLAGGGTCNVAAKLIGASPFVLKSIPVAVALDSYSAQDDFKIDDFTSPAHPFWRKGTTSFTPTCAYASAAGNSGGYAAAPKKPFEQRDGGKAELTDIDLGKSSIPIIVKYFKMLLGRAAWDEVRVIVEHVSERFTHDAKLALDEVLVNHIMERGVDAVPEHVLEAAHALDGVFGPAASELKAHLRCGEWDEAEIILIEAVKRTVFINALALHIKEHGDEDIPISVFVAAAQGSDYFDLLLHVGAWNALKRTIEVSNNKVVSYDSSLWRHGIHYRRHKGIDDIPDHALEAAAVQDWLYAENFFEVLVKRKAWEAVRRVLDRSDKNDRVVKCLSDYIGDVDIPNDVLETCAALKIYYAGDFFRALLLRRAWERVERVLVNSDAGNKLLLEVNLAKHVDEQGEDVPIPVLETAAIHLDAGGDGLGHISSIFEALLRQKAWEAVKRVLVKSDRKRGFVWCLRKRIDERGDRDIPLSVLEAAGLGRRTSSEYRRSSRTSNVWPLRQRRPRKNHFEILGIEPRMDITDKDLAKALRIMSIQNHPDLLHASGDDGAWAAANERQKLFNEAYHTLLDPEKRRQHLRDLGYYV